VRYSCPARSENFIDVVVLGIALCTMAPASVVLTDMPDVVPLISANVLLNSLILAHQPVSLRRGGPGARFSCSGSAGINRKGRGDVDIPPVASSPAPSSASAVVGSSSGAASESLGAESLGAESLGAVLAERYRAVGYEWGTPFPAGALHCSSSSGTSTGQGGDSTEVAVTVGGNKAVSENIMPPGAPVSSCSAPYFDVILASDVVYYPEGYAPLLATLKDLLLAEAPCVSGTTIAGPGGNATGGNVDAGTGNNIVSGSRDAEFAHCQRGPVCILAHRHRHPEDQNFFNALYAIPELFVEKLDFQMTHHTRSGPSKVEENEGSSATSALKDVILFKICRK
jgi:hypothetical protein